MRLKWIFFSLLFVYFELSIFFLFVLICFYSRLKLENNKTDSIYAIYVEF